MTRERFSRACGGLIDLERRENPAFRGATLMREPLNERSSETKENI